MRHDKVIACASRQLKQYEKNYPTYDFELVAVIHALKIWGNYFYGMHIDVYVDRKSLVYIFHTKGIECMMAPMSWVAERLGCGNLIPYREGKCCSGCPKL